MACPWVEMGQDGRFCLYMALACNSHSVVWASECCSLDRTFQLVTHKPFQLNCDSVLP